MNFDKIDLEALQRDLEEFAREQQQRGWFRRNWRWFVPTVLLAVIVLGGAAVYWALFLRVYGLEVCQSAMRTIRPIRDCRRRSASRSETVKWPSRSAAQRPDRGERNGHSLEHRGAQGPRQGARERSRKRDGKMGDRHPGRCAAQRQEGVAQRSRRQRSAAAFSAPKAEHEQARSQRSPAGDQSRAAREMRREIGVGQAPRT